MTSQAEDIELVAAGWLIQQQEPGWSSRNAAELDNWLAESTRHEAAYYRLEHSYRMTRRLSELRAPLPARRLPRVSRSIRWAFAAAASLALFMVGAQFMSWPPFSHTDQVYETPIGAQSRIPLADGSRIELNTSTRLRSDVTATRRVVWLDRGEAFFDIAHDAAHPFIIMAGDRKVTVLGTKFSVRRTGNDLQVNVVEGRVRVGKAGPEDMGARVLTRGETALVTDASELVRTDSPAVISARLSWRDGRLEFANDRLADAAAEFNRYNVRKIEIGDRSTADIAISGQFAAANVDAFVRLLQQAYGITVRHEGDHIILSQ